MQIAVNPAAITVDDGNKRIVHVPGTERTVQYVGPGWAQRMSYPPGARKGDDHGPRKWAVHRAHAADSSPRGRTFPDGGSISSDVTDSPRRCFCPLATALRV